MEKPFFFSFFSGPHFLGFSETVFLPFFFLLQGRDLFFSFLFQKISENKWKTNEEKNENIMEKTFFLLRTLWIPSRGPVSKQLQRYRAVLNTVTKAAVHRYDGSIDRSTPSIDRSSIDQSINRSTDQIDPFDRFDNFPFVRTFLKR